MYKSQTEITCYNPAEIQTLAHADHVISEFFGTADIDLFSHRYYGRTSDDIFSTLDKEDEIKVNVLEAMRVIVGIHFTLKCLEENTWWYHMGFSEDNPVMPLPPMEIAFRFGGIDGLKLIAKRFSLYHLNISREERLNLLPFRLDIYEECNGKSALAYVDLILAHEIRSCFEAGLCSEQVVFDDAVYSDASNLIDISRLDVKHRIGIVDRDYLLAYWGMEPPNVEPVKNEMLQHKFDEIKKLKV